jgi:hypothetical protein
MSYKAKVYKRDDGWWVAEYPHGSTNLFSTWHNAIYDVRSTIRWAKMIVVPQRTVTLHEDWWRNHR